MAVQYKVSKVKNPGKNAVEGTTYFACKASKVSDYTFEELADDIANATTVTRGDALAVLASIKPFIKGALLSGRRVVLNDLGAFIIGVRSKCFSQDAMAASDFSPSAQIKGYHVNFRPEPKLKKEISAAITYRLVKKEE
jgi:predicted histone-like DNA-binding protein